MTVNTEILHFLLGTQVEAQSIIIGAYMDPPENYEQGPVTPENAKPRRVVQFGRAALQLHNLPGDSLAEKVKETIDAYEALAAEAEDESAAADYQAYGNILKAFITISTN